MLFNHRHVSPLRHLMHHRPRHRIHGQAQRGIALLSAMLVVALCATIAIGLTVDSQLNTRRATNMMVSDKTYLYTILAENVAVHYLHLDIASQQNSDTPQSDSFSLTEQWATCDLAFPLEGEPAFLEGRIVDLQGKFNLNNLAAVAPAVPGNGNNPAAASPWLAIFKRLLNEHNLPDNLAEPVVDWIDENSQPLGVDGAEDEYYLGLEKPYRTPNTGLMSSISELALVKGFYELMQNPETQPNVAAFMDDVTVLPTNSSTININTASLTLLNAISDSARYNALRGYENRPNDCAAENPRQGTPYDNVSDYLEDTGAQTNTEQLVSALGVQSQYFLVEAESRFQNSQARSVLRSMIYRDNTRDGVARVIQRSRGTL